ncbi:MAG TPA: Xaa-Pro peptidase family protein [Dongiaceae bacterium]|nr:Xaa-Pro peptidase family protein [Dongiaceae bacterium]
MTIGVGGKTKEEALASLSDMTAGAQPIGLDEYRARIAKAQAHMRANGIDAVYLNAGSSLLYFTGVHWHPSERMVGAILPATGEIEYIAPKFEEGTLNDFMAVEGAVNCWEEHESPTRLFVKLLDRICPGGTAKVGIDESTPFFLFDKMRRLGNRYDFVDAKEVTAHCRMRKSASEIALMQCAKNMTLEVHKAAASILHEGVTTTEVAAFIEQAHRKVGAPGSIFCIVLFGPATAFPHGVKDPQTLKANDVVLIDTGCKLHDYLSDITRTYVFGEPSERQRKFWDIEKEAQAAAFAAAQLGVPCGEPDRAARRVLTGHGLGPDYALPGLPHRTGHGIGLDVHEWPYLVGSDETPLDIGMCFSNEPMICIPGEFGIRHEDHFHMTAQGPKWFTRPAHSIDDPFGLRA